MPLWVQVVVAAAAVVTAASILWTKLLRPGARLISTLDELLPLLTELNNSFRGNHGGLQVLSNIAAEFSDTDGPSLRDVLNRLDAYAHANRSTGELLRAEAERDRLTAAVDHAALIRVIAQCEELSRAVAELQRRGNA